MVNKMVLPFEGEKSVIVKKYNKYHGIKRKCIIMSEGYFDQEGRCQLPDKIVKEIAGRPVEVKVESDAIVLKPVKPDYELIVNRLDE